jgi:hypothetical protein
MSVGGRKITAPLARLARAYHDAIPAIMSTAPAETAVLEQHPQPASFSSV